MDELVQTILTNTYTKTSLYRRFALTREFSEAVVYGKDIADVEGDIIDQLTAFLRQREESQETIDAMTEWGKAFWGTVASDPIEETLHDLYRALETATLFVMYVPVALPHERLADICAWLRNQTGVQLVLDVRVSHQIDVGCAFSFKHQFHDYSYQRRINEAHDAIVEMMRDYDTVNEAVAS